MLVARSQKCYKGCQICVSFGCCICLKNGSCLLSDNIWYILVLKAFYLLAYHLKIFCVHFYAADNLLLYIDKIWKFWWITNEKSSCLNQLPLWTLLKRAASYYNIKILLLEHYEYLWVVPKFRNYFFIDTWSWIAWETVVFCDDIFCYFLISVCSDVSCLFIHSIPIYNILVFNVSDQF
jgi:hypothetical protein